MPIPTWNSTGLVPPIREGEPGHSPNRSPYKVDLVTFIRRFAITPDRCRIMEGFLRYRSALHEINIVEGFQWLDGSYLEDIETNEGRPPNDIDVVTFYHLPNGFDQKALDAIAHDLFDSSKTKPAFLVDAYPFTLGTSMENYNIKHLAYWYSMWSHRRDGVWKGFVQIDLAPVDDINAQIELSAIMGR